MNASSDDKYPGQQSTTLSIGSNHSDASQLAVLNHEEAQPEGVPTVAIEDEKKEEPVTWRSLPHRSQLIVLTLARLSEPLVGTSLQSYMFYQLKSFDGTLDDSTVATQAGLIASAFTGCQFLTAMLWGRVADSEKGGRKFVIMIGLIGTLISCLGFGFAKTFWQAMLFRSMGGALNGNVGVMRTMISEIVQEKRYQSRAFLLFPMCFNIGIIIGPILGGFMADPAGTYPNVFGHIGWLKRFPYAPPSLLNALILFIASIGVFFCLSETLDSLRYREDVGTKITRKVKELITGRAAAYSALAGDEQTRNSTDEDVEMSATPMTPSTPGLQTPTTKRSVPRWKQKLPFRRIFTYNVVCTLIAHTLLAAHLGTFNSLWFVFLSTPVNDPANPDFPTYRRRLPFHFTGGLGMPPRDVGMAMAILGVIGIAMQLFIYPIANAKFGTVKSWRIFLFCFPIAYVFVPYLSIVPSKSAPPAEKDGIWVWLALCTVLFIQVTGRTFALPATTILINNASPHPSVLGTMHGIGQSFSSAARTLGPTLGGSLYGLGLRKGIVGAVFWGLSGLALCNCLASYWVREGDGHEIWLEGDREAEEEWQASRR